MSVDHEKGVETFTSQEVVYELVRSISQSSKAIDLIVIEDLATPEGGRTRIHRRKPSIVSELDGANVRRRSRRPCAVCCGGWVGVPSLEERRYPSLSLRDGLGLCRGGVRNSSKDDLDVVLVANHAGYVASSDVPIFRIGCANDELSNVCLRTCT
jgi:hypothetical protein